MRLWINNQWQRSVMQPDVKRPPYHVLFLIYNSVLKMPCQLRRGIVWKLISIIHIISIFSVTYFDMTKRQPIRDGLGWSIHISSHPLALVFDNWFDKKKSFLLTHTVGPDFICKLKAFYIWTMCPAISDSCVEIYFTELAAQLDVIIKKKLIIMENASVSDSHMLFQLSMKGLLWLYTCTSQKLFCILTSFGCSIPIFSKLPLISPWC